MDDRAAVVFDERLTDYDFGPSHPMAPVRVKLTMALAGELGVLDRLDVVGAKASTESELLAVHTPDYIERVMNLSKHTIHADADHG